MADLSTKRQELKRKRLKEAKTERAASKKQKAGEEWFAEEMDKVITSEAKAVKAAKKETKKEVTPVESKDIPFIPLSDESKTKLAKLKATPPTEKAEKAQAPKDTDDSKVVYIGHIPYGFFEDQLKEFLAQFGEVQRIYLSKNKNGNYRGYGFAEFLHTEVARIVADTMNDYIMFKKRIQCKVLPELQASRIAWPAFPNQEPHPHSAQIRYAKQYNKTKKPTTAKKLKSLTIKKKNKLAKSNIDYQFDGYDTLIKQLEAKEQVAEEKEKERTDADAWEKRKAAKEGEINAIKEKMDEKKKKAKSPKKTGAAATPKGK